MKDSVQASLTMLRANLAALPGGIVAYSGGADSAFLVEVTHTVLCDSYVAVTADSPSLPRRELRAAVHLAQSRGWRHEVVTTDELSNPNYVINPVDRCYFCKSTLFDRLGPMADQLNVPILLGTNLDDLKEWRPGQRAASERRVLCPLVDAGFFKEGVRQASRHLGLETSDKPAAACLSSRFAYGVPITAEDLARVEAAEDYLLENGFVVARVRDLGQDKASVEVGQGELERLFGLAPEIERFLNLIGFEEVVLDAKGYRSGSLNEGLPLRVLQN